jgi:uncharacterized membrane protein YjfL (UPF0719 family)
LKYGSLTKIRPANTHSVQIQQMFVWEMVALAIQLFCMLVSCYKKQHKMAAV